LAASRYYNELNRLYEDIQDSEKYQQASASEKEAFEQKYNEMRTQFTNENGSRYTVINYLEDNYTKKEVLKTDKYRLVMNILKATFTVEELDQEGNVKQSWLSNPTEVDAMFSNRQNSQLVVKFIDGDRSKIVSEVSYDSFSYSTDEECNESNIAWMNEMGKATDAEETFTQCIMFKSNFHSPLNGGNGFNQDEEYTDWQWWLARSECGQWKLMTYGY